MAQLSTVADYITEARVLLQDTVTEYRYSDAELIRGLNMGLMEARRLRPDLFLTVPNTIPSYSTNDSTVVAFDLQYRVGLLYFIVGMATLRDEEDATDKRAAALMNKFVAQLLTVMA